MSSEEKKEPSVPLVSKSLKSSEPDLQVVVGSSSDGEDEETFLVHGPLLASFSDYVDTMLSVPMKESHTRRITFPDVSPDTWRKLMHFLEPGQSVQLEEAVELLPFYDKYGFTSAVQMCDRAACRVIKGNKGFLVTNHTESFADGLVKALVLAYEMNLPLSKPQAIALVKRQFAAGHCIDDKEDRIRDLIPLIQEEEDTLEHIFHVFLGRKDMTVKEMQEATKQESFAPDFLFRSRLIDDQERISHALFVKQLYISDAGSEVINGLYRPNQSSGRGVMTCSYILDIDWNESPGRVIVEALDPFGTAWQISIMTHAGYIPRLCMYTWESSFGSVAPPRHGWSATYGQLPLPRFQQHVFGGGF